MSDAAPTEHASSDTMATQYCQAFPDICPVDPNTSGLSDEERARLKVENQRKEMMYRAIRHTLVNDFGLKGLPATVDKFPGNLSKEHVAQYLAVHGLLLADNYTDPTLGKDRAVGDDIVVPAHDPKKSFFIARRFLDAVVKAVQEYTAQAPLFQRVYDLINEEGAQPTESASARRPSAMARA
jgi:hypothetical protein